MTTESKFHVQRHSDREIADREKIYALLDGEYVAHVGFIDPDVGQPFVIPLGFARDNDRILLHGSTGSRIFMAIAQEIDLCITVTRLDGIVVARSAFNSSMNYECAMIFGKATVLRDEEKSHALEVITDKLIPGLWARARPLTKKEIAATLIVEVSLDQISGKARTGDPVDEESDLDLPIWAGVLPISQVIGAPITANNAQGIEIPPLLHH